MSCKRNRFLVAADFIDSIFGNQLLFLLSLSCLGKSKLSLLIRLILGIKLLDDPDLPRYEFLPPKVLASIK